MSLFAWAGYMTPRGFHAIDFIDLDDATEWVSLATLELIASDTFWINGGEVSAKECDPMLIMDAGMDRLFNRECGGRADR